MARDLTLRESWLFLFGFIAGQGCTAIELTIAPGWSPWDAAILGAAAAILVLAWETYRHNRNRRP